MKRTKVLKHLVNKLISQLESCIREMRCVFLTIWKSDGFHAPYHYAKYADDKFY